MQVFEFTHKIGLDRSRNPPDLFVIHFSNAPAREKYTSRKPLLKTVRLHKYIRHEDRFLNGPALQT